jgi:hypothetical protein
MCLPLFVSVLMCLPLLVSVSVSQPKGKWYCSDACAAEAEGKRPKHG